MGTRVSLHAHIRYLAATYAAAFLVVAFLLFGVTRIRVLLSVLAAGMLSLFVAAGFCVSIALWRRRGIHAVEVDDEALTVYRGCARAAQRLERKAVERIRVVNRLGWHAVIVYPLSGRRFRITEDAFPRDDFLRMCAALDAWR